MSGLKLTTPVTPDGGAITPIRTHLVRQHQKEDKTTGNTSIATGMRDLTTKEETVFSTPPRSTKTKKVEKKTYMPNDALVDIHLWRDRTYTLRLNKDVWCAQYDDCVEKKEAIHTTISFLGKTQNGKSTLIRDVLDQVGDQTDRRPNIMSKGQLTPTSAGVTCYRTEEAITQNTMYFNDYEGEDGGLPADDKQVASSSTPSSPEIKDRQRMAKTDLRRLSYVSSNVIVYVSSSPIANVKASFSDIEDFAKEALEAVGSADRPSLLIVFNKQILGCSDEDEVDDMGNMEEIETRCDPKQFTDEFFATHDPARSLQHYFYDVSVVVVPLSGHDLFVYGQDEEVTKIDTKLLRKQQVQKMVSEIRRLTRDKNEDRLVKGNAFNELVWLALMKLIVKSFYKNISASTGLVEVETLTIKPINMASILLEQLVSDTHKENAFFITLRESHESLLRSYLARSIHFKDEYPYQRKSIRHFEELQSSSSHLPQWSTETLRSYVLDPAAFLSELFDIEMRSSLRFQILAVIRQSYEFCSGAVFSQDMFKNKLASIWEESLKCSLQESYAQWNKYYRPCQLCLKSPGGKFSPISCELTSFNHDNKHQSASRLNVTEDTCLQGKLLRGFRRHILRQETSNLIVEDAVWDKDESEALDSNEEVSMALMDELFSLYTIITNDIIEHRDHVDLVLMVYQSLIVAEAYQALGNSDERKEIKCSEESFCLLCTRKYDDSALRVPLQSCGHSMCQSCLSMLGAPLDQHMEIESCIALDLGIFKLKFRDISGKCPFCQTLMVQRFV